MPKRAHHAVVVVEDGRPVGVMTEHDGDGVDRFPQVHDGDDPRRPDPRR